MIEEQGLVLCHYRSVLTASVAVAVLSLAVGAAAVARTSWLASDIPEAVPLGPELLAEEASDQNPGPMPQPFGPVSSSLLTIVSRIPELSALQREDVNDLIGDGINGAGGVSFRASDGGFVEIMVEQLSTPIPHEAFGIGSRSTTGPSGEEIVIRDIGHTLQVIAISNEGLMVNLLVERINRVDPTAESSLKSITEGQLLDWAVRILEEFSG